MKKTNSKAKKSTAAQKKAEAVNAGEQDISSSKELKAFLLSVRDSMADDQAAPINIVSAMNYVLSIEKIEELLDKESKEVARDIWLRIKQAGVQLSNPPLLFDQDEEVFPQAL